jgi:hypothetical protein
MNYRRELQRIYTLVAVSAVFAGFSFAQTPAKKTSPAQIKPDTWQKSKECAAQAEKLMAYRDSRRIETGVGGAALDWLNHYSPKYNRCFVSANYSVGTTLLLDAFERSEVAFSDIKASDELCSVEGKRSTCTVAADFIAEHMKY